MNPTPYFLLAFWPSEDLNIYISITFRMPCVWSGDHSQDARVPGCQVIVLAVSEKWRGDKVRPETSIERLNLYSKQSSYLTPGEKKVYIITVRRHNGNLYITENNQLTRICNFMGYYSEIIAEIVPFRGILRPVCVFMRRIWDIFDAFIPLLEAI